MTREQKIEYIRQKCVEANPEIIALSFGCEVEFNHQRLVLVEHDGEDNEIAILTHKYLGGGLQRIRVNKLNILGRPIHLADVLLAIENAKGSNDVYYSVDTRGTIYGTRELDLVELNNFPDVDHCVKHMPGATWNLHTDDLTQQSDECIDFLYELLN